jgi:G3E family GTPase
MSRSPIFEVRSVPRPLTVVVGGFLGAGKSSTILEAGRRLEQQGLRVGIITNDQGDELIDSQIAREAGFPVGEVTGGCFCCRFADLIGSARGLIEEQHVDLLLAEAVGSCTDLAATVIRPLQQYYEDAFTVAPLTVVVDGIRWMELSEEVFVRGNRMRPALLNELAAYLSSKQLEEADLITLNKVDLLSSPEIEAVRQSLERTFPSALVLPISAKTGLGLDRLLDLWTARAQAGLGEAGARALEIDYDRYAAAEAQMGWLNAAVAVAAEGKNFNPDEWLTQFLAALSTACERRNWVIRHVKSSLRTPKGWTQASVTRSGDAPDFRARQHTQVDAGELLVNARVETDPHALERAVRASLLAADKALGTVTSVNRLAAFRPSRPRPTYRLDVAPQEVTGTR